MIGISLGLCLAAAAAPPQAPASGFEQLLARLERRTEARRAAARQAWQAAREEFLTQPTRAHLEALREHAPEIQGPLLEELRAWKADEDAVKQLDALLLALSETMNAAGADALMEHADALPLPQHRRAVRVAVRRGGARTVAVARRLLDHPSPALRQSALESLLLRAEPGDVQSLIHRIEFEAFNLDSFAAILDELAGRPLPEDLRLPAEVYTRAEPRFRASLVRFLSAHPQEDAEEFLVARALDPALSLEARKQALAAFEAGGREYRWRRGERDLADWLEDAPRKEAAEAVAWTLYRLGEDDGKDWLLEEPERRAERNPDDWRVQLELARLQVDLDEHDEAYRTFKRIFDTLEGTPWSSRIPASDYVFAARAAAGARHARDAGEWLEASGMVPEQLSEYRDAPEFEPYLDRQPFKRLLGGSDPR